MRALPGRGGGELFSAIFKQCKLHEMGIVKGVGSSISTHVCKLVLHYVVSLSPSLSLGKHRKELKTLVGIQKICVNPFFRGYTHMHRADTSHRKTLDKNIKYTKKYARARVLCCIFLFD